MYAQKKEIQNLSIAGIVLTVLYISWIILFIFHTINWLWGLISINNDLRLLNINDNEFSTKILDWISKNVFILIAFSFIGSAWFIIIILLTIKTTSSTNKILYIVGIFVNLFAFIACILELVNLNKKNINQNPNNYPTNSNTNDSNPQNPHITNN